MIRNSDGLKKLVARLQEEVDKRLPTELAAEAKWAAYVAQIETARAQRRWVAVGGLERQYWGRRNKLVAKRAEVAVWESALVQKTMQLHGRA